MFIKNILKPNNLPPPPTHTPHPLDFYHGTALYVRFEFLMKVIVALIFNERFRNSTGNSAERIA